MKFYKIALLVAVALCVSSAAGAAGWTTEEGGSRTCTKVAKGDTCYVATAAATTSALYVGKCKVWTVTVYEAATSVMPQTCAERACTLSQDLLTTGLTGAGTLRHATSTALFNYVRLVTSDSVTVELKCGG